MLKMEQMKLGLNEEISLFEWIYYLGFPTLAFPIIKSHQIKIVRLYS